MRYLALAALLAIGCVTGEDHPGSDMSLRGDTSMQVSADAGTVDAGPPCPSNTIQVQPCNGDPTWSTCKTTLYPFPAACDNLDRTTQAWRDCIQPPASGCTLQLAPNEVAACVASCQ